MPKRRVLIVEDDAFIAMDLEAVVSKAIEAEIVRSRSAALAKKLIDPSVDLALLDVDVTNGKTFEVATMLKLQQVPFAFLSASGRESIPFELRDAPFIAKPYDRRELVEYIRMAIPE